MLKEMQPKRRPTDAHCLHKKATEIKKPPLCDSPASKKELQ